jgi:tetratricopeptide (TPR) repeat protein
MPFRNGGRIAAILVAVLTPGIGICQSKGTGSTTGSNGTGGSTGGTTTGVGAGNAGGLGNIGTSTTNGTNSTTTAPSNTTLPTPVFISGRVMMDDGTPPPEPVSIERVCINVIRTEGYTDSQGYFGVQLGDEKGVFQDASEDTGRSLRSIIGGTSGQGSGMGGGSAMTDRRFQNCDIRAKLPGYRSQSISLAGHRALDTPDIGVILLHREGTEEGTTVSMVSLQAPKDAKKAFEKGMAFVRKNNSEEAEKEFQRAVELYPKFAAAWAEIGRIQAQRNEILDARKSLDEALKCDSRFLAPYVQIAILDMQARKWQALAEITDRAVRLDPFDFPQIYLFNSVAYYNLKNFDNAERSIEAAAKLDTLQQLPDISHLQGLLLIQHHNYPAAAERLRNYLKLAPDAEDAQQVRTQLAKLDKAIAEDNSKPAAPKMEKQDK